MIMFVASRPGGGFRQPSRRGFLISALSAVAGACFLPGVAAGSRHWLRFPWEPHRLDLVIAFHEVLGSALERRLLNGTKVPLVGFIGASRLDLTLALPRPVPTYRLVGVITGDRLRGTLHRGLLGPRYVEGVIEGDGDCPRLEVFRRARPEEGGERTLVGRARLAGGLVSLLLHPATAKGSGWTIVAEIECALPRARGVITALPPAAEPSRRPTLVATLDGVIEPQ